MYETAAPEDLIRMQEETAMVEKTYTGNRTFSEPQVLVTTETKEEYELDPLLSQSLRNHSPDGFEWGYGGSGPAQLALALLLDHFDYLVDKDKRNDLALHFYQEFKIAKVASQPREGFILTSQEINQWYNQTAH